jgi:hypothetical protein
MQTSEWQDSKKVKTEKEQRSSKQVMEQDLCTI